MLCDAMGSPINLGVMTPEELSRREKAKGIPCGPFTRSLMLRKAPAHVRARLERARRPPYLYATRQGFAGMDVNDANPAAFGAVGSTSVAEVNLWTLPSTWSGIGVNDMRAGKVYEVSFGGIWTFSAGTVVFTGRMGTSATPASNIIMGAASNTQTPTAATAAPFYGEMKVIVRALGVAAGGASVWGTGEVACGQANADATLTFLFGGAATTIDNTIAQGLVVSVTFGSSAAQSFTTEWVVMRSWN